MIQILDKFSFYLRFQKCIIQNYLNPEKQNVYIDLFILLTLTKRTVAMGCSKLCF